MNFEDVTKFDNAAKGKISCLKNYPGKYFLRAMMAGFFITVAVIFSNVAGNVFSAEAPFWGKFIGAMVFAIAVQLIVMVGGELFTGNNLVMAFGAYDKSVSWGDVTKVWVVIYIGNFVGCLIFSLIFVGAGASGTADYFGSFIQNKLSIPELEMFLRAILCNFFVCLAVACGVKLKSESAKLIMIFMCIGGFVFSGFEHCIANMSVFTIAYALVPGVSLGAILKSMVIVTIGNIIGGAVVLALPLRKMSMDK